MSIGSPLRHLAGALLVLAGAVCATAQQDGAGRIVVGSKNFTESCILAELMAQMLEAHTSLEVERRINLGGTKICWGALLEGSIDVYADYTGTLWAIQLGEPGRVADPLRAFLHVEQRLADAYDIAVLRPFGLNNTYAVAMTEERAEELGVRSISDLLGHGAGLRAGFSIEFLNRDDGWPGLREAYGLEFASVRGLEHGLAYQAIAAGEIDVIDAYSTDGKLLRYRLRTLDDDRGFFPPYNAAPLVRQEMLDAHPEIGGVLGRLAFRIDDQRMQQLNFAVEEEGSSFAAVANGFLVDEGLLEPGSGPRQPRRRSAGFAGFATMMADRAGTTLRLTADHLGLTLIAVLLAALFAVPLGILITRHTRLQQVVLGATGVLQTIPSLAMLAFMIPLLGLGVTAAIAALFLYALLPILRNTYTGIAGVDPELIEAARGMGMRDGEILWRVELPLATRTIMAGVRTATVISVGIATLAAFIGAGGLGEPIVTGLYLDDTNLILCGAVPAALLAVLVDLALGGVERWLAPRTAAA